MKKYFRKTLKRFVGKICLIRLSDRNHMFPKGGMLNG